MNVVEAAETLTEMYNNAQDGNKMLSIYIFGIRYANELIGLPPKSIIEYSDLKPSLETELRTGLKLAEYVTLKDEEIIP